MKKLALKLWNEPVAFAGVVQLVVLVPDLPGPRWAWAILAAVCTLGARRVVDGPVTRNDPR